MPECASGFGGDQIASDDKLLIEMEPCERDEFFDRLIGLVLHEGQEQ